MTTIPNAAASGSMQSAGNALIQGPVNSTTPMQNGSVPKTRRSDRLTNANRPTSVCCASSKDGAIEKLNGLQQYAPDGVLDPPPKRRKIGPSTDSAYVPKGRENSQDSLICTLKLSSRARLMPPSALTAPSPSEPANQIPKKTAKRKRASSANSKQNPPLKPKRVSPADTKPRVRDGAKTAQNITPITIDNRPLSWGYPQVWADTRAELCESLPYFNAYQGAAQTSNGTVKSMLLDNDCGERSYLDEEVVVARAGGGIGDEGGQKLQVKDQDGNSLRIISFRNNMEKKIPLLLIVGSNNKDCPSKIPYRYCVMGEFHVTDIWAEKTNGKVTWKFRFEKIDLSRKSWWAPEDSNSSPEKREASEVKAMRAGCYACHAISIQVFEQAWVCLNEKCELHFMMDGKELSGNLDFHEDFRNKRTAFEGIEAPYSGMPKLPNADGAQQQKTFSVTRQCWKGIVCPDCGGCCQRRDWDAWRCQTVDCGFKLTLPREIIPASAVMGDLLYEYQGHAISEDWWLKEQITCEITTHGFYLIHTFHLPYGITVTHGHANAIINSQPGGANHVFRGLQQAELDLKRLNVPSPVTGSLSAHFSKNYGLPYKYVVGQPNSTSFKDAPAEILEAIRRLTWAGRRALGEDSDLVFNEVLAVGYFKGGKMGYHDDGESTLGPHIAAWSLGCPAEMKIRMKYKFYSGFKKIHVNNKETIIYDPSLPLIPGCYMLEERFKLNKMAATMDASALTTKAKEVLKKCPSNAPVIIKMKHRHGDFMSMHGSLMQLYYEHEVVPTHELRFGLTCRYIKPEMIPVDQHSKADIDLDPAKAYDGDLQIYQDWKNKQKAIRDNAATRRSGAVRTRL